MKKTNRTLAAAAAALIACTMFTACGNTAEQTETSAATTAAEAATETITLPDETVTVTEATRKALEEGDVYAINKFSCIAPEGYELLASSEENQGLVYVNKEKRAQIIVRSMNYKETEKDLATFADAACSTIKMNNMLYHTDTDFADPVNMTIAGFDAIFYDYSTTENQYAEDSDEKIPFAWYRSGAFYFYSDKDVYWIITETPKDNYDNVKADFDAFIGSIVIDENAQNGSVKETVDGSQAAASEPSAEETVTASEEVTSAEETSAAE